MLSSWLELYSESLTVYLDFHSDEGLVPWLSTSHKPRNWPNMFATSCSYFTNLSSIACWWIFIIPRAWSRSFIHKVSLVQAPFSIPLTNPIDSSKHSRISPLLTLHSKFTQTHFTPSPHSCLHSSLSLSTHRQWILHKKVLLHISKL